MIARLKYIQKFVDHNGHARVYLRVKGHKPIPLPNTKDPKFFAAYQNALASTAPQEKAKATGSLDALAQSYYETALFKQLGTSTQTVYRRIITGLCEKHGAKLVSGLTTDAIQKAMDSRSDTPAAANHFLRTIRALMRHALDKKIIKVDPCIGVKRLKEVGDGAETWTEEDIAQFEKRHPVGSKARLALALCLYTAQRRSDVVRMGRQHLVDGVLAVQQLKTKTKLSIPLHDDLVRIIDLIPANQMIFLLTDYGKPFTPNGFYMRMKEWVEQAGLPKGRSPHGLRKAACRRLAEAGCSEDQIAAISGHLDMNEIRTYVRAANQLKMARSAMRHLGKPVS